MRRFGMRLAASVCFLGVTLLLWPATSQAISLDKDGDIKLGVRTYVNARVGTEDTHEGVILFTGGSAVTRRPVDVTASATFPHSSAGHLRQNRAFIEAELNHDLTRLLREGVGPLSLLNDLPVKIKSLAYHFTFRGEGEGLYDWGPKEYSTAVEFDKLLRVPPAIAGQTIVDVPRNRHRLRKLGTDRERLFQAYLEANVGRLFLRAGRQILSWGETDAFQLLDHINPIDSSFGGFLIGLDERRVPLDMLLANYYLGDLGPITDAYLEGFAAIDNSVGYYPGTPAGSPWALPSLGNPSNAAVAYAIRPARTINNTRGGFLLKFNAYDTTFSLAHYYTYFDVPSLQERTRPGPNGVGTVFPVPFNDGLPCGAPGPSFCSGGTRDGMSCANNAGCPGGTCVPSSNMCGFPAHVFQTAPKVQVSGATASFAVPKLYGVLRSEVAYFKDEPAFTQEQLDPFIFTNPAINHGDTTTGGRRLRDSFNTVFGWDMNQWIRILNPNQTFTISTQFFYKHIINGGGSQIFNPDGSVNGNREVLPIELTLVGPPGILHNTRVEPIFIRQPVDQYLQTLAIFTSYRSGTINPAMVVFYDWGGGLVYQPSIGFSRDPFRFIIDYSILDSHIYKGGSGVSLLKDRDNVQFRFEYVI
jgi:uncharacterized protein DUF1302